VLMIRVAVNASAYIKGRGRSYWSCIRGILDLGLPYMALGAFYSLIFLVIFFVSFCFIRVE